MNACRGQLAALAVLMVVDVYRSIVLWWYEGFYLLLLVMSTVLMVIVSGGAGGKGTWGKLTEMYDEDGRTHDSNDPNYDSIDEDVCVVIPIIELP